MLPLWLKDEIHGGLRHLKEPKNRIGYVRWMIRIYNSAKETQA